jgi:hypothetical protein
MVPSTVDETRCAVWVVLTETEKGPGSPPPAELLQNRLPPGLDIGGFWQTGHLAICWRKMLGQLQLKGAGQPSSPGKWSAITSVAPWAVALRQQNCPHYAIEIGRED